MKRVLAFLLIGLSLVSCEKFKKKSISSEKDKIIYTIGQMYARRIDYLRLDKDESETIRPSVDAAPPSGSVAVALLLANLTLLQYLAPETGFGTVPTEADDKAASKSF